MKKAFKLFMLISIGAAFTFSFASCDDISFTYRRHQNEDKGGSQSLPSATTKSQYTSNGNGTGTATLVSNGEYWDEINIPRYDLLGDVSSYDVVGICVTLESGNYNAGVGYNSSQDMKWDYDKNDYTWWNKQELTRGYSQTFYDVSFAYSGDNEYNFKFYISTGTAGDTAKITWSVVTHAKLNAGDIFWDQYEDVYLKVNSDGYIDFYGWNEDSYSYEPFLSNAYYNIDNSGITITCSYYDGNYHTVTFTGNFDGITMTLFDEDGYKCLTLTKVTSLNAGDIFMDQNEELYLKVNSYGNIDFYYWNVDTYSYEKYVSNAHYNIENSEITITCSDYDYEGNYYTDTLTGNFDGTTMTLFDENGHLYLASTKVPSVQRSLKTATYFSTITLEDNYPHNNHAMIEWIASDNKYNLNAGQKIKFTIRGFTYNDITVSNTRFTAALVDTTSYANGWRELSNYVNDQYGTMLDYYSDFEAVFIIELTSTPSNASAEACKLELSVGGEYDTQSDITINVSDFKAELLE